MKIALKNLSANCFRKFKRLQLTFQVVNKHAIVAHAPPNSSHIYRGDLIEVSQARTSLT
jgi:hypothetical protein